MKNSSFTHRLYLTPVMRLHFETDGSHGHMQYTASHHILFKAQIRLLQCGARHLCSNWSTSDLNRSQFQIFFYEIKCKGMLSIAPFFLSFAFFLFRTVSCLHPRGNSVRLSVRYTVLSDTLAFPFFYVCLSISEGKEQKVLNEMK